MVIPRFSADDVGSYWIDHDNRVWVVESYCAHPTATLRCLDNGIRNSGAVGCLNFQGLERLVRASEEDVNEVNEEDRRRLRNREEQHDKRF